VSLSTRVLLGLALGIVVGIFFGPAVGFLGPLGDAFIRLLQMTVIPYIVVSLVGGLGALTYADAARLARAAGGFLLVIWGIALTTVLLAPLAYPSWPSASFFSHNLVEARPELNIVHLYIPANPFNALAEAMVPAVVVFTLAIGVALIAVERKAALLEVMTTMTDVLTRVMNFVVSLAPYGVFAIAASAAGTMHVDDVRGLQVYGAVYLALALTLALWTIPALVAALTPFRYREIVYDTRDALITAFATGSVFVVLPVLAERAKTLLSGEAGSDAEADHMVDVVVPTAFNLPSTGKLLALSFVLFAGWISGFAISVSQYATFAVTGLASFVGSTLVAIPFLLDAFRIPADTFRLFVIADQVVGRVGALVAAVHILALTLLSASALSGKLRVRRPALLRWGVITLLLTVGALLGIRVGFERAGSPHDTYDVFAKRDLLLPPALVRVREDAPSSTRPEPAGATLDRIRTRGSLRVGIPADALPYAFYNADGGLVGFDVELAHTLANDLGVSLEITIGPVEKIEMLLDGRHVDVIMGGLLMTPEHIEAVGMTRPYMQETLAFVVRDYRRKEFQTADSVRDMDEVRIASLPIEYYVRKLGDALPRAEIVPVDSPRAFFEAEEGEFDALLLTAEAGASWSLIYPQFTVAVPGPRPVATPVAFGVRRGDEAMNDFLDQWIRLKQAEGIIDRLYDYWIMGKKPASKQAPRWSVIRNVLGWGTEPGPNAMED
jgi:Na+/H+-dicarboxylate symporter